MRSKQVHDDDASGSAKLCFSFKDVSEGVDNAQLERKHAATGRWSDGSSAFGQGLSE